MFKLVASLAFALVSAQAWGNTGNTDLGLGFVNAAGPGYNAPTIAPGDPCAGRRGDSTDATDAINQALADVGATSALDAPGGIVYLPSGIYCVKGTLTIPSNVTLKGTYDGIPNKPTGIVLVGTVLLSVANPNNPSGPPFISLGTGSTVEGLNITYPDQTFGTSWAPKSYPPTINSVGGNAVVQNVFLQNSWVGIDFEGGRCWARNIAGQPLSVGIKIDNAADNGRIQDVNFWPYWSGSNTVVQNWMLATSIAIEVGRGDGYSFNNIFAHGYKTGFMATTLATSGLYWGELNNIQFDGVRTGFDLEAASALEISNYTYSGPDLSSSNNAILINDPDGVYVAVSNASLTGALQSVVINGPATFQLTNSAIDIPTSASAGIFMISGTAMVSNTIFSPRPGAAGAPAINIGSGTTRTMFVGNNLRGATIVNSNPSGSLVANNLP